MMTIFHRRWWLLRRTLPALVLVAGAVFIIVNYIASMMYVESIVPVPDTSVSADLMRSHLRKLSLLSALFVIVISGLFWFALRRIVFEPVSQLVDTSRVLKTGDYAVSAHLSQVNELGEISTALDSLAIKAKEGEDISMLNARLIDIVEHSVNEVYIVDASNYRILSANLAARERHGLDADRLSQCYPWSLMHRVTFDVFKDHLKQLSNSLQSRQVFNTQMTDLAGITYEVEVTLQVLDSAPPPVILIIAKDIQAFTQQYKDLQLRNKAMDALDIGITITDARKADHPLVYVNQGWCKISGYAASELLGRSLRELQGSDTHQPAHAIIEQAQQKGESVQALLKSTRKDGSEFMDELFLSPIHNVAGELTHYIGVNRDVTTLLETQRQLDNIQRLESVGLLSGGIAHDFNNLLTVIQGNLEFLAAQLTDPEQKELLGEAESAADMGVRLTKRLLTFARRNQLEPTALDVNSLVLAAVELLRSAVGESITLSTSLAVDLWPVHSDQSQLENAIINLTINARDAIGGSGRILIQTANETIDRDSLEPSAKLLAGDYVRLRVSDNGAGMTPEVRSRVLEPFFTTKEGSRGTGLGLSTIYGFVRQTGGYLRIDSEPGEGTTVTLFFPRFLGGISGKAVEHATEHTITQNADWKVLVVEDNASVRKVTVGRLHALGYIVEEAADSDDAISMMSAAQESGQSFSVILTDIVMKTDSSGYAVAQWVRDHCADSRVILTSAYSNKRPAGADQYVFLQKPYSLDQLRDALKV